MMKSDLVSKIIGEFVDCDGYQNIDFCSLREGYEDRIFRGVISNAKCFSDIIDYFDCKTEQFTDDAWNLMRRYVEQELFDDYALSGGEWIEKKSVDKLTKLLNENSIPFIIDSNEDGQTTVVIIKVTAKGTYAYTIKPCP